VEFAQELTDPVMIPVIGSAFLAVLITKPLKAAFK